MHIWYHAVCDEHKEACKMIVVNSSSVRHDLLEEKEKLMVAFLHNHYGCALRLIHNDLDLDHLFENNYAMVDKLKGETATDYWNRYARVT